jgi:hypothetical protein
MCVDDMVHRTLTDAQPVWMEGVGQLTTPEITLDTRELATHHPGVGCPSDRWRDALATRPHATSRDPDGRTPTMPANDITSTLNALAQLATTHDITLTINIAPRKRQLPTHPNPNLDELEPHPTHDTGESYRLLQDAGVNGDTLATLAVLHDPERIKHVIDCVSRSPTARNKAAYVRRALERNWYRGRRDQT